jgi:hypothetical protein
MLPQNYPFDKCSADTFLFWIGLNGEKVRSKAAARALHGRLLNPEGEDGYLTRGGEVVIIGEMCQRKLSSEDQAERCLLALH